MSAIRGRLLESVGESQSGSSVWLRTRQRLKRSPGAAGKNRLVSGCIDEARAITCKCPSVSTKRDAAVVRISSTAHILRPSIQFAGAVALACQAEVRGSRRLYGGVALVDGCRSIAA